MLSPLGSLAEFLQHLVWSAPAPPLRGTHGSAKSPGTQGKMPEAGVEAPGSLPDTTLHLQLGHWLTSEKDVAWGTGRLRGFCSAKSGLRPPSHPVRAERRGLPPHPREATEVETGLEAKHITRRRGLRACSYACSRGTGALEEGLHASEGHGVGARHVTVK